eukprot:12423702-Karenia_brevis.AAC.1
MLYIGDHFALQDGKFHKTNVKLAPMQEVFFPKRFVFPWYMKKRSSLIVMHPFVVPDTRRDNPVPAEEATGVCPGDDPLPDSPAGAHPVEASPPAATPEEEKIPNFRITEARSHHYRGTPGCKACENASLPGYVRSQECRMKFYRMLENDGYQFELKSSDSTGPVEYEVAPPTELAE